MRNSGVLRKRFTVLIIAKLRVTNFDDDSSGCPCIMTMVEVNSIDSVPGEAELLSYAADYFAVRLFTPRQRKRLNVLIDVTREPLRVPVTRAMLGPQKAGLGKTPPTLFEMTVSTAGGIRDAAEIIAHEMLHISQAVNGRLLIVAKKIKISGRKMVVDRARWMGGKPVIMDDLAWHLRPWEIEACRWQGLLVDEFLGLATGQAAEQPVQSPKRRQLALYPVNVASPAFVPAQPEPAFDGVSAAGNGHSEPSTSSASRLDSNDASIERVISGAMPGDAVPKETDDAPPEHSMSGVVRPVEPEEVAESIQDDREVTVTATETAPGVVHLPDDRTPLAAMPDRPVYPRPVIEVTVPGLDAPRALEREAMTKKLTELRQRGLATAEDGE